jgi:hypothetical protein
MTKHILSTTAALALMAGMASAQGLAAEAEVTDVDGHQTTVGAEASAAGSEIVDTAQAIGDATGDAVENAGSATANALDNAGEATANALNKTGEVAADVAVDGYSAASDIAARLDAALTADAVVTSKSGETLGTVNSVDQNAGVVIVDLDGEMEGSLEQPIERIALPASVFSVSDDGVMIPLTEAEFAAAINMQAKAQVTN